MNLQSALNMLGWWRPQGNVPGSYLSEPGEIISFLRQPVYLVAQEGRYAAASDGCVMLGGEQPDETALPLVGYAPPCSLQNLGDPSFCQDYGLQYPYLAGAMANGITSAEMVIEMGRHGMMGFFGAGGLSLTAVEAAIDRISTELGDAPYGFNLLHSPNESELENAIVDLYLRRGVTCVSASAYLGLTLPVVRYRVHGIHRDSFGRIITPNRVIAKVSRIEVATHFFSPPPERFLQQLVNGGDITPAQAELAAQIPMAQDLTAEADSGGHTDNRPALAMIPTMLALRDQMQAQYGYAAPLRVGAAGGIGTPASAVAAFAMGAAYILTGSVNQACVESGSSDTVRQMLAKVEQADVTMAPAADMFEMGVKVQVLKRGTMFAMRGAKLYDIYRAYDRIEDIPPQDREMIEHKILRQSFEEIWNQTERFFAERDPKQIERAKESPKHKMALIFRWYLGLASHWANSGEPSRKIDYQIWCGPAMGAFNEWVNGSCLEQPEHRKVVTVALNLLYGAGVVNRLNMLRLQGVRLPVELWKMTPQTQEELRQKIG